MPACLATPYPSGYIVDAGGVLVLRGVPCKDGQSLHFTSVDVYPSSAVHGWDKFDGKPVWSARSKRGIGAVLLGDSEQTGLTVVRAGALAAPTRYQVW